MIIIIIINFYFSDMSVQLPADTTAYKSLTLFKKSIYSHDVRFKNILYRSLAVLLSGFCMIVMNLSSSETAPESTWWRFKRWRRGALASSRAGHSTQKCCSSSTCPVLHDLHILSSTGRPMYLPVSICNGAVPPLNRASRDLWGFILTFCTYSSVSPYSVLKLMYDLN